MSTDLIYDPKRALFFDDPEQGRLDQEVATRIVEAFQVAKEYNEQLADPDFARDGRQKLTRSGVRGSRIDGIHSYDDVEAMLLEVVNWRPVIANLEENVVCFQGELPDKYNNRAYAAYATVREIAHRFGRDGLDTIKAKAGYIEDDGYYFSTPLKFPTTDITVQLHPDLNGIEHLKQWFAGYEKTSVLHEDDGSTLVRCNARLPRVIPSHKNYKNARPQAV